MKKSVPMPNRRATAVELLISTTIFENASIRGVVQQSPRYSVHFFSSCRHVIDRPLVANSKQEVELSDGSPSGGSTHPSRNRMNRKPWCFFGTNEIFFGRT